jgi:DNA-binding FadR family transcriptional regulator
MTLPPITDDPPRDAWRGLLAPGQRLAHDAVAADLLVVSRTTTRTELRGRAA